jgi:hypothetical protein
MKRKICLLLVSILILSNIALVAKVFGQTSNLSISENTLVINLNPQLRQYGYTSSNITQIPEKLLYNLIKSYPNLPSTNATAYTVPHAPTDVVAASKAQVLTSAGTDSVIQNPGTKACLIIAIWDYPGNAHDLDQGRVDNWLSYIQCYADYYGGYAYTPVVLYNSAATHDNIINWLTWLCMYYNNVDVFVDCHGMQIEWWPLPPLYDYGLTSYDAVNTDGSYNTNNVVFPDDLYSHYVLNYDYSALRMGIFGCCYGGCFTNSFLHPDTYWPAANNHDRAIAGPTPPGESNTQYNLDYIMGFVNNWYAFSNDSAGACAAGAACALGDIRPPNEVACTYSDTGNQITE